MEIPKPDALEELVFSMNGEPDFRLTVLPVFYYQFAHNKVYRSFCEAVGRTPENVHRMEDVPYLPISFFKTHTVLSAEGMPALAFESSGTTGSVPSRHFVHRPPVYETSFTNGFRRFYGAPSEYAILGLLPSYLERGGSSLVYMVDHLVRQSGHPSSGFFLHDFHKLRETLFQLEQAGQKTLLIGVTYALLDFAAAYPVTLRNTVIMETGGMKGRKKELLREEVHGLLQEAFSVRSVHSEYGMTELLSQAYADKAGRFRTPPWMKVGVREEDDPFSVTFETKTVATGALNIIDLANLYSCSFIATEDVGRLYEDGSFEVAGRMDNSDVRGCSLMVV